MEKLRSRANILFLKNIKLADINSIEQIMENRLIDEMTPRREIMPKTFINMQVGFSDGLNESAIDDGLVKPDTQKKNSAEMSLSSTSNMIMQMIDDNGKTVNDAMIIAPPINTVPNLFVGIDKWEKRTLLCCWSCGLKFKTVPVPIPIYISKMSDNVVEIVIDGVFCSFSCAQLYINSNYYKDGSYLNRSNMLRLLYEYFTGYSVHYIDVAVQPIKMRKYMGESGLTEEEYLAKKSPINIISATTPFYVLR